MPPIITARLNLTAPRFALPANGQRPQCLSFDGTFTIRWFPKPETAPSL
jgi:hypothetical protein